MDGQMQDASELLAAIIDCVHEGQLQTHAHTHTRARARTHTHTCDTHATTHTQHTHTHTQPHSPTTHFCSFTLSPATVEAPQARAALRMPGLHL
jgi:hypothetical protein